MRVAWRAASGVPRKAFSALQRGFVRDIARVARRGRKWLKNSGRVSGASFGCILAATPTQGHFYRWHRKLRQNHHNHHDRGHFVTDEQLLCGG